MAWHHEGVSSNDSNPGFAFPGLYRQWIIHDLKYHKDIGSIRPWYYEGLKAEDQPRVWRFIEENYLLKYDNFMAVRFDWSSPKAGSSTRSRDPYSHTLSVGAPALQSGFAELHLKEDLGPHELQDLEEPPLAPVDDVHQ